MRSDAPDRNQPFAFAEEPLDWDLHGVPQQVREVGLTSALQALTQHHIDACGPYRSLVKAMFPHWKQGRSLAELPYLPVGIFKQRRLASFPAEELFKTLTSSGTTGAAVSQVPLDRQTAKRQTRALSKTMQKILGPERRPMLLVESEAAIRNRSSVSARGAGVVGMMSFGRGHKFLLDDDMRPDLNSFEVFAEASADRKPLIFGFTFMVWQHLYQELKHANIDLGGATLIHSGGWKKLEEEKVDNAEFKSCLREAFGIDEIVNFYGMAEQVGSVFVEGVDGLLHTAPFADVIMRDPRTWEEVPTGEEGVIQVLSAVPTGYPGHSILTEDVGVVESIDPPTTPHLGKAFRVVGRVPKAELRGCSDTYAQQRTFHG